MNTNKNELSVLGMGVLISIVVLVFAQPAPAKPPITWEPSAINETVIAGESLAVPVTFTTSRDIQHVELRVVPELAEVVSVEPTEIAGSAGSTHSLTLILTADSEMLPTTLEGTIQLRDRDGTGRTIARPLPIEVEIRWPSVSVGGATLAVPPGLVTKSNDDSLAVGRADGSGLPPVFAVFAFDVSEEAASLPPEQALIEIANKRLEPQAILSTTTKHGGLQVEAETLFGHHFFYMNPETRRAVEFRVS